MLRTLALMATLTVLVACTARSGVIPDGPDAYMVIVAGKTGFSPVGKLKISAYRQAAGYCAARGKQMETIQDRSVGTGFLRFPEAEIHFKCTAPAQ